MTAKSSRQTESQNMLNARMSNRPIAIVGMSALFPDAQNLHQYWDNIINRIDSIIDVPKSRWNIEDYYDVDYDFIMFCFRFVIICYHRFVIHLDFLI